MIDVLAVVDMNARTIPGDIEEGHSCCFLRGSIGLLLAGNPSLLSESHMTLIHEARKFYCANKNRSVLAQFRHCLSLRSPPLRPSVRSNLSLLHQHRGQPYSVLV